MAYRRNEARSLCRLDEGSLLLLLLFAASFDWVVEKRLACCCRCARCAEGTASRRWRRKRTDRGCVGGRCMLHEWRELGMQMQMLMHRTELLLTGALLYVLLCSRSFAIDFFCILFFFFFFLSDRCAVFS